MTEINTLKGIKEQRRDGTYISILFMVFAVVTSFLVIIDLKLIVIPLGFYSLMVVAVITRRYWDMKYHLIKQLKRRMK